MNVPAPASPTDAVPPQAPGVVRRTSHIDVRRGPAGLEVIAAAQDVGVRLRSAARLQARVADDRTVTWLEVEPAADLSLLVGVRAASGFRAAVREVVPGGVLAQLLDDLPIAVLLAPYVALRAGTIDVPDGWRASVGHMRDYCSGWAGDATMFRSIDAGGGLPPMPFVPAPALDIGPPLEVGVLRRARRLDVHPADAGGGRVVTAWFRDSCRGAQDGEGVLHEYEVRLAIGPAGVVQEVEVTPRVLPWAECPRAAASGERLVGHLLASAAQAVVPSFAGTETCTHLNDLLRSLSGVTALTADG